MKKNLTYAIIVCLLALGSCSKEDDSITSSPVQTESEKPVLFSTHVEPMMRKACSAAHCHGTTARLPLNRTTLLPMIADGSFHQRIFVLGNATPCGDLDKTSLTLLRSWVSQGSLMD